jgi:hypothetical protein
MLTLPLREACSTLWIERVGSIVARGARDHRPIQATIAVAAPKGMRRQRDGARSGSIIAGSKGPFRIMKLTLQSEDRDQIGSGQHPLHDVIAIDENVSHRRQHVGGNHDHG